MTVQELIDVLKNCPPEAEVVLQKDSEGNGYSPCAGADHDCFYIPENSWSGTVYPREWTAEDADMDDEIWQKLNHDTPDCVVLFPVN